jgi:hypothetical protein
VQAASLPVTRSSALRTFQSRFFALTGYFDASESRGSKNVPAPCICVTATYAFQ